MAVALHLLVIAHVEHPRPLPVLAANQHLLLALNELNRGDSLIADRLDLIERRFSSQGTVDADSAIGESHAQVGVLAAGGEGQDLLLAVDGGDGLPLDEVPALELPVPAAGEDHALVAVEAD